MERDGKKSISTASVRPTLDIFNRLQQRTLSNYVFYVREDWSEYSLKAHMTWPGKVAHASDPSTPEAEASRYLDF